MIKRDTYIEKLAKNRDNGFPKVITGIRRCGKSYLLNELYRRYLIDGGVNPNNIIQMSLDNLENVKFRDPFVLEEYIKNRCYEKTEKYYVFVDEIQLVYNMKNPVLTKGKHVISREPKEDTIGFVELILSLSKEKNIDLYVTGSNSKMLSSDIITEFRDKAINIHLTPLSFSEFHEYSNDPMYDLEEYMYYGGMPLAVLKQKEDKEKYLTDLFKTTYFKDILERNRPKRADVLDELCDILSSSCGQLINVEKIVNTYKSVNKDSIDKVTLKKYLGYLSDAYLIEEANRFDVKGRREIGALRKYYFVDNGLRNARLNFAYSDQGQLLENTIFNELRSNGYTVNIGVFNQVEKDKSGKSKLKDYEIDFLARKGQSSYYIQVCDDISSPNTKDRETRPYFKLRDNIQKLIVVNKRIGERLDENGFIIIDAMDFMLRFIK